MDKTHYLPKADVWACTVAIAGVLAGLAAPASRLWRIGKLVWQIGGPARAAEAVVKAAGAMASGHVNNGAVAQLVAELLAIEGLRLSCLT